MRRAAASWPIPTVRPPASRRFARSWEAALAGVPLEDYARDHPALAKALGAYAA